MTHTQPSTAFRPLIRPLTHIGFLACALALPLLSPGSMLLILLAFAGANLFMPFWFPWALPQHRPGRGHLETVHYPAAILASLLGFAVAHPPTITIESILISQFDSPAATHPWFAWPVLAWATLALGDGLLSLGHGLPSLAGIAKADGLRGTLPWNPRKRRLPLLLTLATVTPLLTWFGASALGLPWAWCLPAIALGLLAESLWMGIDDNWMIPFAVCLVGGYASLASRFPGIADLSAATLLAAALPPALALIAFAFRKITFGGALLGMAGGCLLLAAHWGLFLLLCAFFALGVLATSFGMPAKAKRGIAESRQGKRGMAEVFGAMGVAAWTAPLAIITRNLGGTDGQVALAALVPAAAWVAKGMDTVSSEIGKAIGGKTWSPTAMALVPPGTEGAWSLAGTAAGFLAAVILATLAWISGIASPAQAGILVLIAFIANILESLWARFWDARSVNPGAHTNLILTLAAALMAWFCFLS